MKYLTSQMLKEWEACPSGYKWFRGNYPVGMKFTKKNLTELVERLLRRKKNFENPPQPIFGIEDAARDTIYNLEWLLQKVTNINDINTIRYRRLIRHTDWGTLSQDKIVEYFWLDYKEWRDK